MGRPGPSLAVIGGIGAPRGGGASSLASRLFAANLAARFRASALVGSNGSSVSSWASSVGSYTATGGTAPTLRTSGNSTLKDGRAAVRFAKASSQYLRCDALAALATSGAPMTVGVVLRRASDHDGNVLGLGRSGGLRQFYIDNSSSPTAGAPKYYDGTSHPSGASPPTRTTEDAVCFWVRNPGGTSTVWANGQRVSYTLGSDANAYTNAAIGAVMNGASPANFLDGDVVEICVWSRALADHDVAAATLQMQASSMVRWQIVGVGDSITSGLMTSGASWLTLLLLPSTCLDASGNPGAYIMQAVPARTLVPQALSTDPTNNIYDHLSDVSALATSYLGQAIVVFAGTNDIYYGATGAQAEASMWQICDAIRASNPSAFLVVGTPLPRANFDTAPTYAGSQAPFQAELADLAARIRAGYAAHADMLWDVGAVASMADPNNATKYVDKCHPTLSGQQDMAASFPLSTVQAAAISRVLGRLLAT